MTAPHQNGAVKPGHLRESSQTGHCPLPTLHLGQAADSLKEWGAGLTTAREASLACLLPGSITRPGSRTQSDIWRALTEPSLH